MPAGLMNWAEGLVTRATFASAIPSASALARGNVFPLAQTGHPYKVPAPITTIPSSADKRSPAMLNFLLG
jgi:hypothetical protein